MAIRAPDGANKHILYVDLIRLIIKFLGWLKAETVCFVLIWFQKVWAT